ncbi:MAG: hypothetical protein ACK4L7_02175 [Flavobacteriales bacterium]
MGLRFVAVHWPSHWQRVFEGFMGMPHGQWPAAAVLLAAACRALPPGRAAARLAAAMVAASLIFPFVHGTVPFERSWIHLLVPMSVAFATLADTALQRLPARWAWTMLLPVAGWWCWQQQRHAAASGRLDPMDGHAARVCAAIRAQVPERILITCRELGAYVAFDQRRHRAATRVEFGPDEALPGPEHDLFVGLRPPPGEGWALLHAVEGAGGAWARRLP